MLSRGLFLLMLFAACALPVQARTVYRCLRDGTVSLATAAEPGSKCEAKQIEDHPAKVTNIWGDLGVIHGTLYEWESEGKTIYTTRNLPGAKPYLKFTVETPKGSPAHEGLGKVGKPRLDMYAWQFKAAAKANKLDDAWLRAIAHAESGFEADAISSKGAQGVMQLMPDVIADYGVQDPLSAQQSIAAGARHLRALLRRYGGDHTLAAAAYNAGIGTVTRYKGVPPYRETQVYLAKVRALHARYREAMGIKPERPAQ